MVLSKLDTSIEYNEKKDLYEDDNGYENNVYEIKLKQFKSKFDVSFGKQKLYHIKKNIVFFPIYLLHNGKIIVQIGVVEMTNKIFSKIVEEDDFINLSLLNKFEPLIYSFVKDINIEKYSTSQIEDMNKSEKINVDGFETNEQSDDSNLEEFLFKKDTTNEIKVEEEKNIISEKIDKLWIHQFMNSDQYNIVDNEGGGDCLFSVIRDAYNGLGWKTTVQKLRIVLSKQVDEKLYKNYKEYYTQIDNNLNEEEKELKLLKEETKLLKEKLKKTNETTLQN